MTLFFVGDETGNQSRLVRGLNLKDLAFTESGNKSNIGLGSLNYFSGILNTPVPWINQIEPRDPGDNISWVSSRT